MRTVVVDWGTGEPGWINVIGPTRQELLELAEQFGLHSTSVADCLDPEHLPKYEKIGDVTFLIMRAYDESAPPDADDLQGMTRKLAIFYRPGLVLSIHRRDQPILRAVRDRMASAPNPDRTQTAILTELMLAVLGSFDKPLADAENGLDRAEEEVFQSRRTGSLLRDIHFLKRRIALIKRILWQSISVLQKTAAPAERSQPYFQDLRESAESYHFWADQLLEQAHNLLSLHLAMASQRSNEVMRVLTVFAAFFLPLTFIAGIYGMNFDVMPELRWVWGYPAALAFMAGVSLAIFLWFRRRRWIGRSDG